jgi:hypothetical protein
LVPPHNLGFWPRLDTRGAFSGMAVADPNHRATFGMGGEQLGQRRIISADPFQEDLDPCATQEPDVRPRTTFTIDECAGLTIIQAGKGVVGDIGLNAAAGKIPGGHPGGEDHLGAFGPRPSALYGDQGCERASLTGVANPAQGWPHVVSHSE